MRNLIYVVFLILLTVSCNPKKQGQNGNNQKSNNSTQNSTRIKIVAHKFRDTLQINYLAHKDLLNILAALPDSAMRNWTWKAEERKEFVKFIAKNNFTIDTTANFIDIKLIKPNTIGVTVVDGYFVLSVYKIKPNNYLVITNNITGDKKELMAFEYNNGGIKSIKFESLFVNYFAELLVDKNNLKCIELLADSKIGFEYNFIDTTIVEISNQFYIKENKTKNCFNGNALIYKFNPVPTGQKKFDLIKKYWKH